MSVKRFAQLFVVLLILISPVSYGGSFKDLSNYKWAESAVSNMASLGYVNGFEDGTFRPEANITRAQFVSIINKMNGLFNESEKTFKDVTKTHWAYKQIAIAIEAGYINGFDDGTFRPNAIITREQMAAMINNLYYLENNTLSTPINDLHKTSPWAIQAVVNVLSNEIMSLDESGNFNGKFLLTRINSIYSLNNLVVKSTPTMKAWLDSAEKSKENVSIPTTQVPGSSHPIEDTHIDSRTLDSLNRVLVNLERDIIPNLKTSVQNQTALIIKNSIVKYISNPTYSTDEDVQLAKMSIKSMPESDSEHFLNMIQAMIQLEDIVRLNDIFKLVDLDKYK